MEFLALFLFVMWMTIKIAGRPDGLARVRPKRRDGAARPLPERRYR